MHEPGVEIGFPSPFSLILKAASRKLEILADGGLCGGEGGRTILPLLERWLFLKHSAFKWDLTMVIVANCDYRADGKGPSPRHWESFPTLGFIQQVAKPSPVEPSSPFPGKEHAQHPEERCAVL